VRRFTVDGYVRLKVRTDKYDSGKICLFVEVEDTGVGVSNEDKEKLFKPFSQVGSAAQQAMGTGLGLNGVRQKARNLGGECGVRDNVPVGAVFWFRIPYLPTDDDLQHMQNPLLADTFDISSVPGNVSRDILVVEDEVVLQKLTCRLVTSFGLSAVPVRTAAHALERMQVSTFLAVLCDLTLSDTSGADVVKEQQRREAAKESPPQVIFIVSGTVRQEDFDAAIAAGAVGTASKPLMKGKFVEFLHAALSIQLERNRKRTHTSTAVHTKKLAHIKSPNRTMNRKGSLLGRIAAVQPDQSFNVPEVLPKILLIDKNDTLRRSAAAKLLFLGCYVKEADGGCQGLEMLQQEVFDLALVDLKLPVMDGFRVISEFRKWEKLSRTTYIPIFAMSAGPTAYVSVAMALSAPC
jgi:CheY-like chemotaxis protein